VEKKEWSGVSKVRAPLARVSSVTGRSRRGRSHQPRKPDNGPRLPESSLNSGLERQPSNQCFLFPNYSIPVGF
jgi:hypothetical protein